MEMTGGEMEDHVRPFVLENLAESRSIQNVALHDADAITERFQEQAWRVVERANTLLLFQETLDQVRPDQSASARNQTSHE